MHIVLVTICYPPEIRTISSMMRELAEGLHARGHRVTVLTSWPQYNLSDADRQKHYSEITHENGVRVIRIKTLRTHHTGYITRGIAHVLLPYFFRRAVYRFVHEHVDAVIVYSPHLPLTHIGAMMKKRDGAVYLLNIQDIFPQNAIDLGILKNVLLIRMFEWIEQRAYACADAITTHTRSGRAFLIEQKQVPAAKISVISNWIDVPSFSGKRTGVFRKQWKREDSFICIFPGVFGPAQGLPFLIEVARGVASDPRIVFVLVGDGTEQTRLRTLAQLYKLRNVHFFPFVSPRHYPTLLHDADVGVISLAADSKTPAVPGKLYGFMAARLPVLGFLNRESDAHTIIAEARCGVSVTSEREHIPHAVDILKAMARDPAALEQYGKNGYDYAKVHFSKDPCITRMESLLSSCKRTS